jgi:uncharacterized protein involved in outer membrane biogenesis
MSDTYVEPIPSAEPLEAARSRPHAWGHWAKRALVALALLWMAAEGISLAIQHTRLRGILTAQFEATMGRPVEVGSFHFSLWDGPVVQARSVTVAEDPRFGAEYFLRTDSMAVRLRWRSLLHGRVEFDTISLTHPSLNLVRNSSGEWNLAEWLPRPGALPRPGGFAGPIAPFTPTRLHRIEIDGGRINFKLEDEKLPFAFVGVHGAVEMSGPGRWRLSLQAIPWRAAVALQQAGTIQVLGDMGGTSSRLRPASIDVSWAGASLSDVLRLARGDDFGLRGALFLSIDARTDGDAEGWKVNSQARLRQLHRWDLALRPDNPSLNVVAQMAWRPSAPVELTQAIIEAPHSNLRAKGILDWSYPTSTSEHAGPVPQVVVSSAQIDADDLLAWARAFHSGIADNLSVGGLALVDATVSGWPPRLVRAQLSSNGMDFSGAALVKPARVGRFELLYDSPKEKGEGNGLAWLGPISVSWGSTGHPDGSFRFEKAARRATGAPAVWHLSGSTIQVRDLVAGAGALGWNISRGWDLAGPFACDLRWRPVPGTRFLDALRQPLGWMEFGASDGAVLRAPFLNLPIQQIKAWVDLKPGVRQASLISAQAFGARWRGTLQHLNPSAWWQFDLAADRFSAADLDRWLNPRWRGSFLDRMLPFLSPRSEGGVAPGNLQATGHLSVGRFSLASLEVSDLQTEVEIHGRRVALTNAEAQFYGGPVRGSFEAGFDPAPSYHANLDFSHIDVSVLIEATPSLASLAAGSAAGRISFDARGSTRAELVNSLLCQGDASLEGPELQTIHLSGLPNVSSAPAGALRFLSGSANFSCGQGRIQFHNLVLEAPDTTYEGSGTIDFHRNVNLDLRTVQASPVAPTLHLAGTLSGLEAELISSATPRRTR